jgi:hypothetical protein
MADFDWKALVRTIAPVLGGALGGPMGAVAARTVSEVFLGRSDGTEEELANAVRGATQEQLLALKQADQDFIKAMRALELDEQRIAASDRDSARKKEMALNDWTPKFLSVAITAGFFGILIRMLEKGLPDAGGEALLIMLGTLGTAFVAIVTYHFGSSAGSMFKSQTLDRLTRER